MKGTPARLGRIFLRYGVKIISLLLAVSIIAFTLVSLSPVDPVQQYILGVGAVSAEQRADIEEYWGVNDPPVQRYFNWLGALLRGDMGESLLYRRPVAEIIGERFVNSLALMLSAWLFSGIIGFALGCVMGRPHHKENLLPAQQRTHLLAGPAVPPGILRQAGLVPHRLLQSHRRCRRGRDHMAAPASSFPPCADSQPYVLRQHRPAHPAEAR